MSPDSPASFEPFVPLGRLVELLGVPMGTLYRWCYDPDGKGFPYYRVGRHSKVRLSEVDAWLRKYAASPGVRDLTPRPHLLEGIAMPDCVREASQHTGNCVLHFWSNGSPEGNGKVTQFFKQLAARNPNANVIFTDSGPSAPRRGAAGPQARLAVP